MELYLFLIPNKLRDHCCTRKRYFARYKVLPFMKEFDLNLRNEFVNYSAVGKYAATGRLQGNLYVKLEVQGLGGREFEALVPVCRSQPAKQPL